MEYRNKDANHVEWAKALKELYLPGLRDYVKSHYALGPVWNASGKPASAPPAKGPPGAPAPPPAPVFSSESSKPSSSSNQKQGMSAVFQQLSSGAVTSGMLLRCICLHVFWRNLCLECDSKLVYYSCSLPSRS